jgi:hypothetical protein
MYKNHRKEGVVAVDGHVDLDQILALRAFRGVPSEEELDQIIDGLLDEAENQMDQEDEEDDVGEEMLDEEEPTYKFDKDDEEDGFGPGSAGGGGQSVAVY